MKIKYASLLIATSFIVSDFEVSADPAAESAASSSAAAAPESRQDSVEKIIESNKALNKKVEQLAENVAQLTGVMKGIVLNFAATTQDVLEQTKKTIETSKVVQLKSHDGNLNLTTEGSLAQRVPAGGVSSKIAEEYAPGSVEKFTDAIVRAVASAS
ncbi:MAG: hypothetical protein LBF56_03820 [Holosporales bacterium]|nr:hypothetical protein [Holosporales bacterium]